VSVNAGIRLGELLGSRWEDLDRHNGELHISQAIQRQDERDVSGSASAVVRAKGSRDKAIVADAATSQSFKFDADPQVGSRWRYLLPAETDVRSAKGSWEALKATGS